MSREQRRAKQSDIPKQARHATTEEIIPGDHGPVQTKLVDLMKVAVDAIREELGSNYDVTLFVAERTPPANERRLPRFNYMSTAARKDMIAVLKAFADRNALLGQTLDKLNDAPPTGTAQ
jgi:hypothetical protein